MREFAERLAIQAACLSIRFFNPQSLSLLLPQYYFRFIILRLRRLSFRMCLLILQIEVACLVIDLYRIFLLVQVLLQGTKFTNEVPQS